MQQEIDNNNDGFRDVPFSKTASVLNRWEYDGKKFKDLNALCMAYDHDEYPVDLIVKNSCKGLAATVKMKLIK